MSQWIRPICHKGMAEHLFWTSCWLNKQDFAKHKTKRLVCKFYCYLQHQTFKTKEVVRPNMKMAIYPSICSKSLTTYYISYSYVSLALFVQVLDKNEWKSFRSLISSHRKLRRCGKKLPRYCDTNHDRKISLTEWLHCLNAQRLVAGKWVFSNRFIKASIICILLFEKFWVTNYYSLFIMSIK